MGCQVPNPNLRASCHPRFEPVVIDCFLPELSGPLLLHLFDPADSMNDTSAGRASHRQRVAQTYIDAPELSC